MSFEYFAIKTSALSLPGEMNPFPSIFLSQITELEIQDAQPKFIPEPLCKPLTCQELVLDFKKLLTLHRKL